MAKKTLIPHSVRLEFAPGALVHSNLSGAAFTDDWLWVAGDEACAVDRLRKLDPVQRETLRFGEGQSFPLADLLDLPGEDGEEADLEGMGLSDGFLWVVGSHGSKRKNAKRGCDDAENAKRLTKLKLDGNRRLLACLPIEQAQDGSPQLVRQAADGRRALRLKGDAKHNQLTDLLADDPHFGPFLKIPGKDNGFDIEGIVVDGQRLLLGLRGPVLRGWSRSRWKRMATICAWHRWTKTAPCCASTSCNWAGWAFATCIIPATICTCSPGRQWC